MIALGVAAGEGERRRSKKNQDPHLASSSSMTDGAVGLRARRLVAAAPGVVLRVADGIVRIGLHVAAGKDLGGRRRPGIDVLIGVAAGKGEGRDREDDVKPHGRFPTVGRRDATRARGRSGGELGHQVSSGCRRRLAQPIVPAGVVDTGGFGGPQGSKRRQDAN